MMFTVGELANLHGINKQTLIYYDNIDLFKPNIVDESNRYRYYTSDQLEILDSILILREIGIPIKEIKSFLTKRDDQKALSLLKNQKCKLDNQLKNIQRTIKKLENKIDVIENLSSENSSMCFKEMKCEYMIIEPVDSPFELLQTDIAFKKLLKNLHNKKCPCNYLLGTIISYENLIKKRYTLTSHVFLPLYESFNGENIIEKSAGIYAIALHKGDYNEIGKTYESLINYISKNNYEVVGPSFEYCILDSLTSYTPRDYLTKIVIEVKPV